MYSVWPSAATRASPVSSSVVAQPPAGSLAMAGQAPAVVTSGGTTFSDTFSTNSNPIASPWTHTATAFDTVKTASGFAQGVSYTDSNNDSYCKLSTSAFQAPNDDYEVTCTVQAGVNASEIEILLRLTDDTSGMNCYEVLYNTSGGGELVRINGGGPGGYVEITSTLYTFNAHEGTGDKIRARVTGTNPVVITAWGAPASNPTSWTQLFTYSDTDANRKTSGQPGMGFYQVTANGALGMNGWTDFSATAV